jgi:GR25 family glycosyltransferase involved in LPS biosynthesis
MKSLFLLFLLSLCNLQADVFDFLKKAENKSDAHCIKNIDFIYMINLDQRPEKFSISCQNLAPYHIRPYRFSAVNGWELSLETLDEIGVKYGPWMTGGHWGTCYPLDNCGEPQHEIVTEVGKTYFSHCMSRGAIGIVMSHLSILQDAYDSGYQTVWVMEDDVEVIRNPHLLSDLIEELDRLVTPDGWDILFTDRDTKNQAGGYVPCTAFAWRPNFNPANPSLFAFQNQINANFRKIGARYGAYSMIVRRSGMKKILDFFKRYQIFLPFDMEYTLVPKIQLFTVTSDVVSTIPQALSDNGFPGYKNKSL